MSEPIHILSLGAGVQSSTMALMAAAGEILPMPQAAIFADTQDEPRLVYDWLDWLETELPFKVHRVTNGRLSERSLAMVVTKDGRRYSKTDIPFFTRNIHDGSQGKIVHRGCTRDFKLKPLMRRAKPIDEVGNYQWCEELDWQCTIHQLQGNQRDTTAKLGDEGTLRWHRLKGGKMKGEWRFVKG